MTTDISTPLLPYRITICGLNELAGHAQSGFSHVVSLGGMVDVDFGDMLDWLASDRRTRAILLYIESIESPRKFMSAARAAARAAIAAGGFRECSICFVLVLLGVDEARTRQEKLRTKQPHATRAELSHGLKLRR